MRRCEVFERRVDCVVRRMYIISVVARAFPGACRGKLGFQ